MNDVGNNDDNIGQRKSTSLNLFFSLFNARLAGRQAEAIIETEAPNARKIVAFFVKNRMYKLASIVGGGQISITQTFMYFYACFINTCRMIFGKSFFNMYLSPLYTIKKG